ncbi:MAG: helix-turn-helix transcriptional regulator [Candidatus Zixiibacteriota bacterium]|nr:MAG: helix-turn-helix transcriptional regulator [candidate division Zixibacteria bacterium]
MGLKQVDLAKLLGVSEKSVFNWENDRCPTSPGYRQRIKETLGIEESDADQGAIVHDKM